MIIGFILIAVGIIALLNRAGVIDNTIWSYTWPTILIILGLWFLDRWRRKRSWWGGWYPRERGRNRPERDE